jgi:NADH-quinone oxidoreductase subunit C
MGDAVFERVRERLAGMAGEPVDSHGVLALESERLRLLEVVHALRDELGFDLFLDVTAVDWPAREPRFDVVWHFYSTRDFVRVCLKARVPLADPTVDTLVALYGSARYMERECHDMYGIVFRGNDDLRPILLYEGFVGHPLRKDYPKRKEQPLVPYRDGKP